MTPFKEGDKSKALCEECGLVDTTFKHRTVLVSDHPIPMLAGVCDKCNIVVSIPAQETPNIQAVLQSKKV